LRVARIGNGADRKTATDERLLCVGCRDRVPETHSEDTNFASTTGWRMRIRVDEKGARHPEWRCPDCWKAFKATVLPPR
jgi:hypothetical protein